MANRYSRSQNPSLMSVNKEIKQSSKSPQKRGENTTDEKSMKLDQNSDAKNSKEGKKSIGILSPVPNNKITT